MHDYVMTEKCQTRKAAWLILNLAEKLQAQKGLPRGWEDAQGLRAWAAPAEGLRWVPSTHIVIHSRQKL